MAYALFVQDKIVLTGLLNNYQLQQTQRRDEQNELATDTLGLQQQMSSIQASQSIQLAGKYEDLANTTNETDRASKNAEINALEAAFDAEIDQINRKIYQVSVKENTVEMAVKRLDTEVTAIEKQLEDVEKAEGEGIDRSTPKFSGIG